MGLRSLLQASLRAPPGQPCASAFGPRLWAPKQSCHRCSGSTVRGTSALPGPPAIASGPALLSHRPPGEVPIQRMPQPSHPVPQRPGAGPVPLATPVGWAGGCAHRLAFVFLSVSRLVCLGGCSSPSTGREGTNQLLKVPHLLCADTAGPQRVLRGLTPVCPSPDLVGGNAH